MSRKNRPVMCPGDRALSGTRAGCRRISFLGHARGRSGQPRRVPSHRIARGAPSAAVCAQCFRSASSPAGQAKYYLEQAEVRVDTVQSIGDGVEEYSPPSTQTRVPPETQLQSQTERRRNRTFQPPGYDGLPVLKTARWVA